MPSLRTLPGEPHWLVSRLGVRTDLPIEALRSWLYDPGSLTSRLMELCAQNFRVEVQRCVWQPIEVNERLRLKIHRTPFAYIREVVLYCGSHPLVFARTVIPARTVQKHHYLLMLGNRPLGAALFADPSMHRGTIEVTCLTPSQRLFSDVCRFSTESTAEIWGRRSLFKLGPDPLLVAEYFLPNGVPL
jgi:chorismate lyase